MKSAFPLILLAVMTLAGPAASSGQPARSSIAPRIGVQPLLKPIDGAPELRIGLRRDEAQGSLGTTLISTVALGAAGGLALGAVGSTLGGEGTCGDSDCGFVPMLMMGTVGVALGTGVGAHLGNGSRGNLGLDLLGGALGTAVGVLVLSAVSSTPNDGGGLLFFVPVPIVLIPVFFERSGARKNYSERTLSASVAPAPGGLAVALTARW